MEHQIYYKRKNNTVKLEQYKNNGLKGLDIYGVRKMIKPIKLIRGNII